MTDLAPLQLAPLWHKFLTRAAEPDRRLTPRQHSGRIDQQKTGSVARLLDRSANWGRHHYMKRLITICMLAMAACAIIFAPDVLAQSQSAYNLQQNEMRSQQSAANNLNRNERQTYVNTVANLTKLRAKLAEAWQALGMSPQAAQAVANAYQPNSSQNLQSISLRGKSGQEVAAMLQSALAKRDYMLANRTLIEYEKIQTKLGTSTSPVGQH